MAKINETTVQVGSERYPVRIVKAFVDRFPFTGQRLADQSKEGIKARDMLEAFYAGWEEAKK